LNNKVEKPKKRKEELEMLIKQMAPFQEDLIAAIVTNPLMGLCRHKVKIGHDVKLC